MSLVFYDTETTGTETSFDQILQFAAIRTDENLNEIDRFEIRCRLLPHLVPAPGAMRVTGVRVSQLINPSLPSHYEMVRVIREKLLSWSPAQFIGWNSIAFDEHLIRQALYKTLHNPYLTNTNGNSRSDAMRMVQLCSLFAPSALTFPTNDDGKKVFKLDHVAPANGFKHDQAHDALGDVLATKFICQQLFVNAPDIWSSFMRFSKKAAVIDYISGERTFCLCEFFYGSPHSWIVTTIGQNQENNAEWYVYDLNVDPDSLKSLTDAELTERIDSWPKPLRRLKSNAAPMLLPTRDAPEICKGLKLGMEELERRARMLQGNVALSKRLISAFESLKEEYPPSPHVEKQIYDGFVQKSDEILMEVFHKSDWPKRCEIVDQFLDPRLRTIGRQLIHHERPDLLDKAVCREHDLATANRLMGQGEDIAWLTVPKALEEIEEMLVASIGTELELLREHKQYLRKRLKESLGKTKRQSRAIGT